MDEYGTVQPASKTPWLLTLIVLGGSAAGGYYLNEKNKTTEAALEEAKGEIADLSAVAQEELAKSQAEAEAEKARVKKREEELNKMSKQLEEALGDSEGELSSQNGRITLQLVDKVLFPFGEAELTDNGKKVLSKLGEALKEFPKKQIWVQGHTDDVPVSKDNENFASNWELSAFRAVNVVHYLEDEVGVDPSRLAAVAFSEYRPVSKNKKNRNRRIEIVLAPEEISVER